MTKFLQFILGVGLGVAIIYYNQWLVRTIGRSPGAERYLGSAGTYSMWKIIGVIIIAVTVLYTFGGIDQMLGAMFGFLGGKGT